MRVMALVLLAMLPAGCGALGFGRPPLEQRTTHGPTAEQAWLTRMYALTGRDPTFEERNAWQDHLDAEISRYLREHPEAANAFDVHTFRYSKQVAVGMSKEQVSILLGPPQAMVTDAAEMEKLARKYWPDVKDRAKEVWVYPGGWRFFFADGRVIDITQYISPDAHSG